MQKTIDDPTSTDVDDTQVTIEGYYFGPSSVQWTRMKRVMVVLTDKKGRKL